MGAWKRCALFLLTLATFWATGRTVAAQEPAPVIAGVPRDFYPEYAIDVDDRPAGFAIDVMNAVAKRADLHLTYRVFATWADAFAALEKGDIDLIPVVVITPAREGQVLFTRPVVTSRMSVFVRQDTSGIRSMADPAGRRFGVIKGGPVPELLGAAGSSPNIVSYPRLQDEMFALLLGEVDAIAPFETSAWKVAQRAGLADRIKVAGEPLTLAKRAIAVRRGLPELRDRLDTAVAELLESTEYRTIVATWHAAPPPIWTTARMAWIAGAATTLFLLGMLVWQSSAPRADDGPTRQPIVSGRTAGEGEGTGSAATVVARTSALIALALGLAVLCGWAFDLTALKNVLPGLVAMQPWTATGIATVAASLLLATTARNRNVTLSITLAGAVVILGLIILVEYALEVDLGIDLWLFPSAIHHQPSPRAYPGRPSDVAAVAFVLLGGMLLVARFEGRCASMIFAVGGAAGLFWAAAPLLGYLIDVNALQGVALVTHVALHTSIGLMVLFIGTVALRPGVGWMATLSGRSPGAASARMLLPVVIAGPVLLAWLFNAGRQTGLYGPDFQAGLAALATTALLTTALLWSTARVDLLDRARRAGAEALRDAEADRRRLRGVLDLAVAIVRERDGIIRYWAAGCEALYGYTAAEAIGRVSHELLETEFPAPLAEIDKALTDCGEWRGELRHRRKNGSDVWVSTHWVLHADSANADLLVLQNNTDITSERKSRQELRESEIRLRTVLDACPDGIMLLSTDGRVLTINRSAERRLARSLGERSPIGEYIHGLLPPDEVEQKMAMIRQVAGTAAAVHREIESHTRCLECWYFPVLSPVPPVAEVAVYSRDITEQKKSQAELQKLFQAIEQSPSSVVITDREGKIEYVNPKFAEVTGYTLEEAVGQNTSMLKSERTSPECYADLWRTISSGGVWRGELLNKKKNGELFWELASIAPVKHGAEITNYVAVKLDITERRAVEEQLRQAQKMEAIGQLTGGIAHDFNNLLAIIMSNLEFLERGAGGDAKAREWVGDALWAVSRGAELTRRLLAFAQRQPLKPAVIDLNVVVGGMGEMLRRTLGATIDVVEKLAPDLWQAFVDRGELERALLNLAVNARDAMPTGGTLTLATHNTILDEDYATQYPEVTPGEYVLLEVVDTGTGIPPEIVHRVFEPFFTTKGVGKGSGLGLSMIYGFVKQSHGHVSIYSHVGKGTCVKLYLPRPSTSSPRAPESSPEDSIEALADKVILVVEDEPKLRKVAVKMLERLGLRCIQAETAKDALELLAETHVDVLFTDIELPGGMSGTELAEVAHRLYPELKVLFTTGYAKEASLLESGLHERAPWLLKPYTHQKLARELKILLVPTVQ